MLPAFPRRALPCAALPGRPGLGLNGVALASLRGFLGLQPAAASSQLAGRAVPRRESHVDAGCAADTAPWSAGRCAHPARHLPHVGEDDHVQHPLNGAIVHALDPGDLVSLILENLTPAAAGRHGGTLAACSRPRRVPTPLPPQEPQKNKTS